MVVLDDLRVASRLFVLDLTSRRITEGGDIGSGSLHGLVILSWDLLLFSSRLLHFLARHLSVLKSLTSLYFLFYQEAGWNFKLKLGSYGAFLIASTHNTITNKSFFARNDIYYVWLIPKVLAAISLSLLAYFIAGQTTRRCKRIA